MTNYDVINVTEYDYCFIKDCISDINKVLTLQMTASVQTHPRSQFDDYDKNGKHHILTAWTPEFAKNELSYFKHKQHLINVPYTLKTSDYQRVPLPTQSHVIKIGIFTRISPLKPIGPFIYALHLMRCSGINVNLHIYGSFVGSGTSKIFKDDLDRTIRFLGLTNHVVFEGHQRSLKECLEKSELDLAWFQGMARQLGGYSALELMLMGLPHMFWDFDPMGPDENQGEHPIPYFWNLQKFVTYTSNLLMNRESLHQLATDQRKFIEIDRDTKSHMSKLEGYFDLMIS